MCRSEHCSIHIYIKQCNALRVNSCIDYYMHTSFLFYRVLYSNSCEYTSEHLSHNLLHLLTDLMHYFHLPPSSSHPPSSSSSSASYSHDSWQNELSLLRERQELFQKQGMLLLTLNIITETGLKCRVRCSPTATLIHHKLYELLAAMIRGNRKNCSEFATGRWLKVFIDQLNMPEFTHDVLEVIHCLLTDSPEVLNIITKEHIQVGTSSFQLCMMVLLSQSAPLCSIPALGCFALICIPLQASAQAQPA